MAQPTNSAKRLSCIMAGLGLLVNGFINVYRYTGVKAFAVCFLFNALEQAKQLVLKFIVARCGAVQKRAHFKIGIKGVVGFQFIHGFGCVNAA